MKEDNFEKCNYCKKSFLVGSVEQKTHNYQKGYHPQDNKLYLASLGLTEDAYKNQL